MNKEKIRELAIELRLNSCGSVYRSESEETIVNRWFEQNQPEPIVVGLSDEQVCDMVDRFIGYFCDDSGTLSAMEDWNSTEKYLLDSIRGYLKTQKFTHDWDDAPEGATVFRVFYDYLNENRSTIHNRVTIYEEQRPKPTLQVEVVGQIWECSSSDGGISKVTVIGLNSRDVAFQYHCDDEIDMLEIVDFLAKFERTI